MNELSRLKAIHLISGLLGCAVFIALFVLRPTYDKWFYLFISAALSWYIYMVMAYVWTGIERPDFKALIMREDHKYNSRTGTHTYTTTYKDHSDSSLSKYLEFYVSSRHLVHLSVIGIPILTFLVISIRS